MIPTAASPYTPLGTIEHDIQVAPFSVETLVAPVESTYGVPIAGVIVSRAGSSTFNGALLSFTPGPGPTHYSQMRIFRTLNREAVRLLWINTTGVHHFTWLIGPQTGEVWWTY